MKLLTNREPSDHLRDLPHEDESRLQGAEQPDRAR